MRVFGWELKKMADFRILGILAVAGLLLYLMFMEFYTAFGGYPNGHPLEEYNKIAIQWVQTYGNTMEPKEYEQAKGEMDDLLMEADAFIASHPAFAAAGIQSYAQFIEKYDRWAGENSSEEDARFWAAESLLFGEESGWLGYRIQALEFCLGAYELDPAHPDILSDELLEAGYHYFAYGTGLLILGVFLVTAPFAVRDSMNRMRPIQWSGRMGRRMEGLRFLACLAGSVLLAMIGVWIFAAIFSQNGVRVFWNSRLDSFLTGLDAVLPMTYGQYFLGNMGLSLLLAAGACPLFFCLSQASEHYIAMLLKGVPVLIVYEALSAAVMFQAFYRENTTYRLFRVPGAEWMAAGLLLAAGLAALLILQMRMRKKDLLD